MKPKSSRVWAYFTDLSVDNAKCNICNGIYSRKGRSTTSLKNHLRSTHPFEYAEFLEFEIARTQQQKFDAEREDETMTTSSNGGGRKRKTTHPQKQENEIEYIDGEINEEMNDDKRSTPETLLKDEKTHWDAEHPKSQEMDRLITEMIAVNDLSAAFIQGAAFRRVLQAALPWYNLRDKQFFSTNMRSHIYPKLVRKIKSILRCINSFTFTKDATFHQHIWQFRYTCHGITPAFRRFSVVLKYARFASSDDSDCGFKDMIMNWGIPRNKVHCLVYGGSKGDLDQDDGRKVRHSNNKIIDCSLYELELCVREAILAEKPIEYLIGKCDKITKEFHKVIYLKEIIKIQEQLKSYQAGLSFMADKSNAKSVRFPYHRLQRFLRLKDTICELMNTYAVFKITSEEWKNIKQIVKVLQHFEDTMQMMNYSQKSISAVIPLVHVLKQALHRINEDEEEAYVTTETIKDFIHKLFEELNIRFGNLQNNKIYALATYLDPRYKLKFFDDTVKERVQAEILRSFEENPKNDILMQKRQKHSHDLNYKTTSTINTVLAEILNSSSDIENEEVEHLEDSQPLIVSKYRIMKALLSDYNKEIKLNINEDPLLWWKENTKYREFYNTARQYLAPPSGTLSVEPLFEELSTYYDDKFNISSDNKDEEKRWFIKNNLPLLNFQY